MPKRRKKQRRLRKKLRKKLKKEEEDNNLVFFIKNASHNDLRVRGVFFIPLKVLLHFQKLVLHLVISWLFLQSLLECFV